jgi:hypothetical protein
MINSFTVTNPPSSRPFNFKITTYYVDGSTAYAMETFSSSMYQCINGNISAVVTPATTDVSSVTTYTINFTISHPLVSGSFINIVFPP